MTRMLNGVLPKKSQINVWFEVNNQILNALFTLMCLYQHPKRFHHLVLLIRWKPKDVTTLREMYCKNGKKKPHGRAHIMVVIVLLLVNCFAQYALCRLNWGYKRSERPAAGDGISLSVAIAGAAIAGVYTMMSSLGKEYDLEVDEEVQDQILINITRQAKHLGSFERRFSFASRNEHSWWSMNLNGMEAPFWIFNLAVVNIDNETIREALGLTASKSALSVEQEEVEFDYEEEEDDPTAELSYLDPETDPDSISEWELDFCSRPILDIRGKKCLSLLLWLDERYESVYTRHPGFQKGSKPLLILDNPFPMELPENPFREKWAFVQLPLSNVKKEVSSLETKPVFGASLDLDLLGIEIDENTLIPGLAVASSRAKLLAEVDVSKASLILSVGISTRYVYARYKKTRTTTNEAESWEAAKKACGGLHFLAVQEELDSDDCVGFWLLLDLPPPPV
ncbi:hypothetical protein FEM48_Zijuj03G0193100 [Ziziphus jujuba var. spinosa]|uniref:RNA-binding protein Tab2/Atab2 C-terminal domain-containing protein n=1 Tax=Ziziphus jujuba var. spinosa TaxID=714518 RepID=A0A978VS53_ZIZJJ|nr:hypothetical protein FEM48_Zijuj03G0193100 [Ziziphus jujuba var. spinosa]